MPEDMYAFQLTNNLSQFIYWLSLFYGIVLYSVKKILTSTLLTQCVFLRQLSQ
jgi:hypothetical protein